MDLFDFSKKPFNYAVVGNPVSHSKSPEIHHLFAEQFGLKIQYTRKQVDLGGFVQAVDHFQAHGGRGLNITAPFKKEAFNYVQNMQGKMVSVFEQAYVLNTIGFDDHGKIWGANTDGVGLCRDLRHLGVDLTDCRILLIGAGGAAQGCLGSLCRSTKAKNIVLANRTIQKAEEVAMRFDKDIKAQGFESIKNEEFDLVINASSASLFGQPLQISDKTLRLASLVYDMSYSENETVFMKQAKKAGASLVVDGLGMLVEQAAESFSLWHNKTPDTSCVLSFLRARA